MKFTLQVSSLHESKQWPQILAVTLAGIASIIIGTHFGWPSPALAIILSDDFPVNVTSEEASYIPAFLALGNLATAPLAGYLLDVIGRKYTVLFIALTSITSWMIFAFANSALEFYIGRFICGISTSFYVICLAAYAGEVTEPSIRGVLGGNIAVFLTLGMLFINCYGPFVSIRDGAFISSVFPILLVTCFIWMPESPYYLIMKGKLEEAKKSLYFLRRCNIDKEFQELQRDVGRQLSERGSYKDLFTVASNRRALFIIVGLRAFQQFSGASTINMFTQSIFKQADINVSPIVATSCYYAILVVVTACGSHFSDKYGRRPLVIFSIVATGIVLNIGGVYFLLQEVLGIDTSSIKWFPILVMISYCVLYSIGLEVIPYSMLGELFSTSVKGKALCITCISNSVLVAFLSKFFYFLSEQFGLFAGFFFCGEMCILGSFFTYYFVPETKGKTLEEIQQYLKGHNETNAT